MDSGCENECEVRAVVDDVGGVELYCTRDPLVATPTELRPLLGVAVLAVGVRPADLGEVALDDPDEAVEARPRFGGGCTSGIEVAGHRGLPGTVFLQKEMYTRQSQFVEKYE